MYVVWGYTFYLLISVALTIWVAQTLSRNGLVFLVDAFLGNRELANSVNHLLVVGFYLINVGYVSLALKYRDQPANLQQVIEVLSSKVGMVLIVLGAMHFFNLYVFNRMRKRAITRNSPPPVMPQRTITPPPQPAH